MKTKNIILLFCALVSVLANASENANDSLMIEGKMVHSSDFFRDRILYNSFVSFLDNYSEYTVVQNEVVGDFHSPDRQLISIQGNSYRWTKYRIDGHRVDSRLLPGSTLFSPNMYNYEMSTNLTNGTISFEKRRSIENNIMLRYNQGNIGGKNQWSDFFVPHATALEREFRHINDRKYLKGQGNIFLDYTLNHKDQELKQHLYVDFGKRQLIGVDYAGYASPYDESYAKAELMGELHVRKNGLFKESNYAIAYAQRNHMNHEFYYNPEETAQNKNFNFSLWGNNSNWGTGINFSVINQKHNNKNFTRNYVDMDGESLNPFYPDATMYEWTHHLAYDKMLSPNLELKIESYNSIIHNNSDHYSAANAIYYKSLVNPETGEYVTTDAPYYTSLYLKEFSSQSFTSGILENSAQAVYQKKLTEKLSWQGTASITLDGILVKDRTVVRPNWEFNSRLEWKTKKFFSTSLILGRNRLPFHYDMITYLSTDYLNGKTYYWTDTNNDEQFQSSEKGDLLAQEGGHYRHLDNNIKQPVYWIAEWPMHFKINKRHRFSVYTTYKKYVNMWQTEMQGDASTYGFYSNDDPAYYFFNGTPVHYTINSDNPEALDIGQSRYLLRSTPFVFTNIIKYSYEGKYLFSSFSLTSQAMVGVNTSGNSIQENNLEFFSDLAANPNTHYKQAGRPQQDRAYLAHLLMGYKKQGFRTSLLVKFIDGQPFTHYQTALITNNGQTQVAQRNRDHKGGVAFIDEWGSREDLNVNMEFRMAYTFALQDAFVDVNLGVYNLFDFATELNEATYALPASNSRIPIEISIPRGLMISTKLTF